MPGSGVRTAEHGDLESQYEELDVLGGGRAAHQPERRMLSPVADVEPSSAGLLRLIYGYQVSQAIHVAAALGIPDQLAEGPRAVGDLASSIGAHAGALYRLLRALAAVEVLHEEPDGSFALTDLGEALRGPAGSLAAFIGRPTTGRRGGSCCTASAPA